MCLLILIAGVLPGAASAGETHPGARGYQMMVFDPGTGRMFMHGGLTARNVDWTDTWVFDAPNASWTERTSDPRPPAGITMTYDNGSQRILLWVDVAVGGCCPPRFAEKNDMWAIDPVTSTWTLMPDGPTIPILYAPRMAYDSQSDMIVMFGVPETSPEGQTWAYDYAANKWTRMAPPVSPEGRNFGAMAYDPRTDRTILFGGTPSDNVTWAYDFDNDSWESLGSTGAPATRHYTDMAYDPGCGRMVLYGGWGASGLMNDTWTFDATTGSWVQMHPQVSPSARGYHSMAYDERGGRVLLFGGGLESTNVLPHTFYQDTWAYDCVADSWSLVDQPRAPSAAFTFLPASPTVNETVTFNGSLSADPDGTIRSYAWAFADGNVGDGIETSHAFSQPGPFNVTLEVRDADGLFQRATIQVNVSNAPPPPTATPPPQFLSGPGALAPLLGVVVSALARSVCRRRARRGKGSSFCLLGENRLTRPAFTVPS